MADSDSRVKILNAAVELFCRRGYGAVGTQEICDRAGVLKGTMYHFFPTKLALATEVLRVYGARVAAFFASSVAGPGPPAARLARMFAAARAAAEDDVATDGFYAGCLHGGFTAELAAAEPSIREALKDVTASWVAAIAPVTADPAVARAVLAYLAGVEMAAKAANDPAVITRLGKRAPLILATA